jgi:quinol monooxygenase YgiN
MSKTAILAKLTAQSGKRDELVEALGPLVDAVNGEAGTELYVLHTSPTDPDVVWFYELYTDQESLQAHSKSDAMKQVGSRLAGLLAGPPDLIPVTPLRAAGVKL